MVSSARAGDDDVKAETAKKPSVDEQMAKIVKLGPGVHAVNKACRCRFCALADVTNHT
jgi:hypothetical protein